ncbi:MAG: PAS domain-containing protein, partial [Bacteroidota bacterium]
LDVEAPAWYNEAFWATLGINITSIDTDGARKGPQIHPAHQGVIDHEVSQALLHPENLMEHEARYLHTNGEYVWLRCHGKLARHQRHAQVSSQNI